MSEVAHADSAIFRLMTNKTVKDGCWVSHLKTCRKGYARINVGGVMTFIHRLAYQAFKGQLEEEMTIDHLCRNTSCFNPAHLEQVTNEENLRRGSPGSYNAIKTHCVRGHEFSQENTYRPPNKNERLCRECMRMHGRINDAKRRARGRK